MNSGIATRISRKRIPRMDLSIARMGMRSWFRLATAFTRLTLVSSLCFRSILMPMARDGSMRTLPGFFRIFTVRFLRRRLSESGKLSGMKMAGSSDLVKQRPDSSLTISENGRGRPGVRKTGPNHGALALAGDCPLGNPLAGSLADSAKGRRTAQRLVDSHRRTPKRPVLAR